MANLISWLGQREKAVVAQLNPFDNGATYNTVRQNVTPAAARPVAPTMVGDVGYGGYTPPSTVQQVSNLASSFIHPFSTFGTALKNTPDAINREIHNKPITDLQEKTFGTSDSGSIARQILGDATTIGLTAVAPGASRIVDRGVTKVAPSLARPLLSKTGAPVVDATGKALTKLNLPGRVISNAVSGPALGASFGVSSIPGSGQKFTKQNVSHALKSGSEGGLALGVGTPIVAAGVKGVARVANKPGVSLAPKGTSVVQPGTIINSDIPKPPDLSVSGRYSTPTYIRKGKPITPPKQLPASGPASRIKEIDQAILDSNSGKTPLTAEQGKQLFQERQNLIDNPRMGVIVKGKNKSPNVPLKTVPKAPVIAASAELTPAEAAVAKPTSSGSKTAPKATPYQAPLPSSQNLGATVRSLANKVTVLKKINTPSSHELAGHITAIDNLQQTLRGINKNRMPVTFSLNPDEMTNLGNVVEHGAKPLNDRVAQAAQEARTVFPDIHSAYTKAGGETGNRANYFPRDYSNLKVGSPDYNHALQELVSSGQAKDLPTAVNMLNGVARGKRTNPSFFGNFDRPRLDVSGYGYTKEALQSYLNGAAKKTAEATHLGPKGEIANQLIANIAQEGGDAQLASKALENYLHEAGAGKTDILAPARGFFGAVRLGKAPISHLGQSTNIPLVTRLQDLPVAIAKSMTKEGKDYIEKSDVNNPANIHGLAHQETSVKGGLSKVTAYGLSPVMRMNRGFASLAGREYGNYLVKNGKEAELRDLGVSGTIGRTLTEDQQHQVSRGVTNKTMFNPTRAQTPVGAETPHGKTFGQYRTAYSYKQGGLIWNNVLKAAGNGDLKPLAKFVALSVPVTAATVEIKNKFSGKKEGRGGEALDAAAALGGIPGELAIQGARYGKGNILKTVAGSVAPVAGEAVDLGQRAQAAIKDQYGRHNLKPLEAYGAGLAGPAGSFLSKKVLASGAKPTADTTGNAPNTPQQRKANETAERKTLDANPNIGNGSFLTQLSNGTYAYWTDGDSSVSYTKDKTTAKNAIAEASLKASGDSYKVVGDTVYRKSLDGSVSTEPKIKYDYQLGTATLTAQKNGGDLGGWLKTAHSQLDNISKQLADPNTDPLDALTLQNDAESIENDIDKYSGYGGFTKPKSGSSGSGSGSTKAITSGFKTASSSKAPAAPKGVSVRKLSAPSFGGTAKKLSVSKIPSNYTKKKLL